MNTKDEKINFNLLENIFKLLKLLLKNVSLIIVTASVLGATIQLIYLTGMSVAFLTFYSPSQALVDGGIILIYLLFTTIAYFTIYYLCRNSRNNVAIFISLLIVGFICVFLSITGWQFFVSWFIFPFLNLTSALGNSADSWWNQPLFNSWSTSEQEVQEKEISGDQSVALVKMLVIFFIFVMLPIIIYYDMANNRTSKYFESVINSKSSIEKGYYDVGYANKDFIFVRKRGSESYKIYKMDNVLKDEIE